jgi:predicted hotdog family 3-hydroxylacyl-ACP dehydratase
MRLIDRIDAVSADSISCAATSHLSPDNPLRAGPLRAGPLRAGGHLPVSAAIEYAAQAMAVHGALSRRDEGAPRRGFLVIASGVAWTADRLDIAGTELRIDATCLASTDAAAQYSFTLSAGPAVSVSGTLMLQLEQAAP